MLHFRGALLGLMLTSLAALSQAPQPAPTTPPPATNTAATPEGTAPANPATPAAATAPTLAVSPTQVAATVNGEAIYEGAVQRALDRVPPARRTEERPRLLNYLIDNLLIDQALRGAGYKVEEADIEKRVTDMKTELKKVNKEFDKMLKELKVTEQELRMHIAADLRWFKYANTQATDKALAELFTTSKDMFDGTAVRARHILITSGTKDEKGAAAAVAQIRQIKQTIDAEVEAGMAKSKETDNLAREKARTALLIETFAKYAKEKSECPTKNNGGDVGWFQKAGFIVAPFSQAAFLLQPNQMSDAILTPFGYHLILVTERKPGREVKFEDVKEVVREVFFERLHDNLAQQIRQKANIAMAGAQN